MYVFNTWVIANMVHPFIYYMVRGHHDMLNDHGALYELYSIFFLFILFSTPSLIMGWVLIEIIDLVNAGINRKFFIWLLLVTVIPLINVVLFGGLGNTPLGFSLPAMISVFLTVTLRSKQFFKRFNDKNNQHEKDTA